MLRVVFSNEDCEVLREKLTGLILVLRATGSGDPSFAFEMTLHANAVAALTGQLARIDHGAQTTDVVAAGPGSRTYGVPSVKAAWYGQWRLAGTVSRQVFWPVPNVDSVLVAFERDAEPRGSEQERRRTFAIVDAAFQQRRKMLRQALSAVLGGTSAAASGMSSDLVAGFARDASNRSANRVARSVAMRSVSRFVHLASSSADGAVPIRPGWWMPTYEHSGMWREVATSPRKSQITL